MGLRSRPPSVELVYRTQRRRLNCVSRRRTTKCQHQWILLMTPNLDIVLPRDASAAYAVVWCLTVCLSVCLSVTFVSVEMNKQDLKKFSPSCSGSHTILVFPYQTSWQYSDGDPPNGGVECRWGRHIDSGRICGYRIDECCSARSTIDGRRSVVYNIYSARLFTAENTTHQWIRRREDNRAEFICKQR